MATKNILRIYFLLFAILLQAQKPTADIFNTTKGTIKIQPILHSTFVIQWNKKTIYFDPYGGENAFKNIEKPNMIIITDIHSDHLNLTTLQAINTKDAIFVVPEAVAQKLPQIYHQNLVILNNNESTNKLDVNIKTIPMYNLPETSYSKHPKGRGNGYVLTIEDKNIYISGDTEDTIEMRNLKNIDIAFVCMNLPYTMDINQAASAVLEFKPKIVYPFHYRGKPDFSNVEAFKKLVNEKNPNIEVRLKNWYPNYN